MNNEEKKEVSETKEASKQSKAVPVDVLEQLIKTNEELKLRLEKIESNQGQPKIFKKIKDHIVRISRWKGNLVVGFDGDLYQKWDDKKRQDILYVDLVFEGGKTEKEVPFLQFLNSRDVVEAKIISRNVEEKEIIDGYVNKAEFDGNYNMIIKDAVVPLESIIKLTTFEVELPNNEDYKGRKLQIDEKYVNIQ